MDEVFINTEFGTFPQVLEWKPPCCSCVVFIHNGTTEYFDYHYKCSQHSHLDGQDLIDTLAKDYQDTPPIQWKSMKTNSIQVGGGVYADPVLKPKRIVLQKSKHLVLRFADLVKNRFLHRLSHN